MREKHLLRTLATGLATMAIPVFSPMTLTAQTHSKLPPEVQAKRAAAKSAQQKKGHSARKAKATGVQILCQICIQDIFITRNKWD